jgi:hypothetical protein
MTGERATLDSITTAVALLAVIALGLAAGAMLAEGAVLVPYWRSLPPESFLAWYADNAARLFDFFGPLEIASTILAVAAAVLYLLRRRRGGAPLAASALLAVAVLASFPLYFQEVNASFEARTIAVARVPEELARWAAWHCVRTAIGIAAFAAALLGVCYERR